MLKNPLWFRRCRLVLASLAVAGTLPALAANLQWTTNASAINDGPGTWNQGSASVTTGSGAWYNGTSYGQTMNSGDNVTFGGGAAGAAGTVTIGTGGVSPGNITFSNANGGGAYTLGASITGPAITMSGGLITNSGSAGPLISCPLNGSFTYAAPNKNVVLGANGNQTAVNTVTIVSGSSLQIGNAGGAGSLGAAVITNNGALQWRRDNTVNISNVVYGTGSVTILGDGATYVIYSNLFYTGTTKLSAYKSSSPKCLVQLGGSNVLPTNTDLTIFQNAAPSVEPGILDLNGFNQTVGSLAGDQYASVTSEVVTNSSATPVTLTLGGTSKTTLYGGLIAGNLSLVLNGSGSTLTLSNTANTYTGNTTISNGALKLTAISSLASPAINLSASVAVLDVSTVTSGYTLGNGQSLSGIGVVTGAVTTASGSTIAPGNAGSVGTLNFSNNLTLNGNLVFKINKSLAQSNDIIQVSGSINNSGTGTLTVNNFGPVPVAGDKFKLFSAAVLNGGNLTITSSAGSTFANNLAVDGSITVLTAHANTNALLSSLVVTPAGTLLPTFTPTGFIYLATNSTGQTPTVTVANADPTATNTLFFNGVSQGTLASGVPSGVLTLSAGTNVVKVLVTAQDGVTTNLYTVNVIGLPRNLTWTTNSSATSDGPGTWNQGSASVTAGNGAWFDGTSYGQVMNSGDNVTFGSGSAGAGAMITNGPGLTPGNITFKTPFSGDYTIGTNGLGVTGNPITMNGGLITNTSSSSSPTINCPINGSFTYGAPNKNIVFAGNGNQTPANSVTIVSGSTIQLGNNSGAGSVGAAIITNNGTLQWRRNAQNNPINVSNVVYGTGGMLILGDGATYVIYSNLFYTGSTKLSAYNSTSTKCLVQLGGNNVLPTNTALIIAQNASPTNFSILDLNGFNQTLGSLASDANATAMAEVVTNSSATPVTLTLGGTSVATTYGGLIAGNLSLVLNGTGSTLTLSNASTYTGSTTISNGTLKLNGSGSIASSANITVAGGAAIDVSGLSAVFTLGASQTLSNSASGAIINGTNNTGSGTVSLLYNGLNPSFIVTNGGMTLSASTVFKVNNPGAALGAGAYLIISNVTAGAPGLVAGTAPSVNLSGNTFANTTAALQINSSGLNLVIKTNQNITFASGTSLTKTYGNGPFPDTATASSGLTVNYSSDNAGVATVDISGTVTIVGAGNCNIIATNSGNGTYNPAFASQSLTVNKANSSLTYGATVLFTYDGTAHTPGITSITGSTGDRTTNYVGTGSTTYFSLNAPTNVGTYYVSNSVASDANYNGTNNSQAFMIIQAGTFVGASSTKNPSGYKDSVAYIATLPADATGSVVFSSTNGPISTNSVSSGSATSLSITNLPRGTNVITVAYLGDGNYLGSTTNLEQIVTNHPPVATDATYYRAKGLSLKIAITNLLTYVTDVDGDTNSLQSVGAGLTNATIMTDSTYVYYLPGTGAGSNDNDVISYTVSDGFGGTATTNILVNVYSAAGPAQMSLPTNGVVNITFHGIPNYTYIVQTTTNLSLPWWTLSTNTASTNGIWQFTDPNATNAQQYYRSSQP